MDEIPFGRYRLIEVIGEGGMGRVYKTHDTITDRAVALKVLPEDSASNPAFRERFQREAYAVAGLQEPHVVPIHDFGEIEGRLYLDMRLIEGTDLKTLIAKRGALSADLAVSIIDQVAAALDAAHAAGIIHRDVKPSNIIVSERNFVYLIDFGIARTAGEDGLTSTGMAIGTFAYMAPERFTTGDVDKRADVYALACVLYESLTGTQPFDGDSLEQQIASHLTADTPKPSHHGTSVIWDSVIAQGMAKNPNERIASAEQFAAIAKELLHSTRNAVTINGRNSRTPATKTQENSSEVPTVQISSGKGRVNLVALSVIIVAALVAGITWTFQHNGDESPASSDRRGSAHNTGAVTSSGATITVLKNGRSDSENKETIRTKGRNLVVGAGWFDCFQTSPQTCTGEKPVGPADNDAFDAYYEEYSSTCQERISRSDFRIDMAERVRPWIVDDEADQVIAEISEQDRTGTATIKQTDGSSLVLYFELTKWNVVPQCNEDGTLKVEKQ